MIENIYSFFFIGAMCILVFIMFAYFVRTIIGPHFSDRILAVNSISTIVILLISMIAILQDEAYIIDIALIYALLGFITVVVLCKAYLASHKKDREKDLENIKPEVEKND